MASRYRMPQPDAVGHINQINGRLAKLERVPRAPKTSVDKGSMVFNGGTMQVNSGDVASGAVLPIFTATGVPPALDQLYVDDTFDRTVANGWGTTPDGLFTWLIGSPAADYSVNLGIAHHNIASVNVRHTSLVGSAANVDAAVEYCVALPAIPTGAPIAVSTYFRGGDPGASQQYDVTMYFNLDATVTMNAGGTAAGTRSAISSTVTLPFTYIAGFYVHVLAQIEGQTMSAKAWLAGTQQPIEWQLIATDSGTFNFGSGMVGVSSILQSGNTNTRPFDIKFSDEIGGATTGTMKFREYVSNRATNIGRTVSVNTVKMFRNSVGSGVAAFEYTDTPTDPSVPWPSTFMRDRAGNIIFSDACLARGLSHPRFNVPFWDQAASKSTTSGTYTNFMSAYWNVYHPCLRVILLANCPAATNYDVHIMENSIGELAYLPLNPNTFQFYVFYVFRTQLSIANKTSGYSANLDIEWRRTSGTGTATMTFVEGLALDTDAPVV